MKRLLKTAVSLLLTLVLAFSAARFPSAVKAELSPAWSVPAGYNENDYNRIVSFLEQTDASGVKNGTKLSPSYNPNYPATWGVCFDPDYYIDMPTFSWEQFGGEYRVRRILIFDKQLVGDFDLSGLSELYYANISANMINSVTLNGCTSLWTFDCYDNLLHSIDVSVCPMLHFFRCDGNLLVELDVSANPGLIQLTCSDNLLFDLDVSANSNLEILDVSDNLLNGIDVSMLAFLDQLNVSGNDLYDGLDVSHNPRLQVLRCSNTGLDSVDLTHNADLAGFYCVGNPIVEFDFYANDILMLNVLEAEGDGTVGCELNGWYTKVYAAPTDGASFEGWYDAQGNLISNRPEYEASELDGDHFIARFTSASFIPGDADGNGSVTVADAILALRYAMGLLDDDALVLAASDMDGNGSVSMADAVAILRIGMGL
ncbi:MAG: hypothetical protein IKZ82_13330 [Clostridia bacterium]|nr:hypothetical protein [Clostridia bacterium]